MDCEFNANEIKWVLNNLIGIENENIYYRVLLKALNKKGYIMMFDVLLTNFI